MCNNPKERNKKSIQFFSGLAREVVMVKVGKAIEFVNTCKKRVEMGLDWMEKGMNPEESTESTLNYVEVRAGTVDQAVG